MNLILPLAAAAPDTLLSKAAKWLLNFDYDKISDKDIVTFKLLGLPQGWGLLILILCVAALIWLVFALYRREGKASRTRKMILAAVRTLVIALALVLLLAPTLVVSKVRETFSPVAVLLDASESSTLEDLYSEKESVDAVVAATGMTAADVLNRRLNRQQVVTATLNNSRLNFLNRLAEKNPVQLYRFATTVEKLREVPLRSAGTAPEKGDGAPTALKPGDFKLDAAAGRTYIGRAQTAVLEAAGGQPLAAIIILSDGQDNDSDLDATTLAGEYASREGVPVYAVPIGLAKSRKTKNLRVEKNLQANRTVFVGDPAEFTALVSSSGYPNVTVKAELCRQKVGETREQSLASQEVAIEANAASKPVSLSHTPLEGDEGEYIYTMKIGPLGDEQLQRDNVAVASGVRIVKTTTNVLMIAGSPTYEYRHLRNLLVQDKSVVVSSWLQNASKAWPQVGDKLLTRMPTTRQEIFDPNEGYHVIILIDIDPTDFDVEWFKLLEEFVSEKMGGLLYIAGEKYTYDLFKTAMAAPLLKMLPVEPDMDRAQSAVSEGTRNAREWPLKPTEDGLASPLLKFSTEREMTERIWASLPGSMWAFPLKKAKPAATVLVRTMDPRWVITTGGKNEPMPDLVSGFFGTGRVMFLASDETWRWRRLGTRVYDTFWTQAVRSLVEGRLVGGKKTAILETDSETYPLGNPVTVTAKVFDATGKPATWPDLKVTVELTGALAEEGATKPESSLPPVKTTIKLDPVPGAPGTYKKQYPPPRTGYYKLTLLGPEGGGAAATTSIAVASQYENDHPESNPVRLAELTDPTAGGGVVDLRDIGRIPDRIESKKEQVIEPGDQFSLWANPLALGLIVLLLGIEWTVRKRSNMA